MRWKRTLQLLDVHCEGEIGRVVTGGAPKIPGNTVAEQLHWMNTDPQGEALRRFLTLEPRGTPMGSVNLLLPPKHPDAHAAFVILRRIRRDRLSARSPFSSRRMTAHSACRAVSQAMSTVSARSIHPSSLIAASWKRPASPFSISPSCNPVIA